MSNIQIGLTAIALYDNVAAPANKKDIMDLISTIPINSMLVFHFQFHFQI